MLRASCQWISRVDVVWKPKYEYWIYTTLTIQFIRTVNETFYLSSELAFRCNRLGKNKMIRRTMQVIGVAYLQTACMTPNPLSSLWVKKKIRDMIKVPENNLQGVYETLKRNT